MNNAPQKLRSEISSRIQTKSIDAGSIELLIDKSQINLVNSLVGLLASEDGFNVKTTADGIRISQIDHLTDEEINEIADLLVKTTGARINLTSGRRMVQQNKPVMGYPKNGGLAAVSNKYNCMVSGEKRANPCAGCGNPKGCLSGAMQFKRYNIDG